MVDEETILEEQKAFANSQRNKSRRYMRIHNSAKKDNAVFQRRKYVKMRQTHGFPNMHPHDGESIFDASRKAWDYDGKTIQNTGIYLQHPKNSNRQNFYKRESHHKVRHYFGDLNNGRHEQKLYDYDWNID